MLAGVVFCVFLAVAGPACGEPERQHLRVGFIPNVTHAVPMVMEARGTLERAVGRPVEMVPFNAGPSVIEALLARDLDLAYVGPSPAINAYIRSGGRVRVVAAAAHGGAAFVVRKELAIDAPADLNGKRFATPQIGNTQDVALRSWLSDNDLHPSDRGGSVQVFPMANSEIYSTFRAKEIDGAWVVEPWVSRLLDEGGGRVFIDEASLHDGGRYPTTLLVVTDEMLRSKPEQVATLASVNRATVKWVRANPRRAKELVNEALEKHTGKKLTTSLLDAAWRRLSFDDDPVPRSLRDEARAARRIGYLPRSDVSGLLVDAAELSRPARTPAQRAPEGAEQGAARK